MNGKLKLLEKILSKKKILLLEGGINEEHEISLSTAKEVKKIIHELNYNLQSLTVNPKNFINEIKKYDADICFNALHGTFGEDGKVQKILLENKIKFTHSGVRASRIAFNKHLTKKAIEKTGIFFPKSFLFNKSRLSEKMFKSFYEKNGSFVLKPVSSGSSYGVQVIKSLNDIKLLFNEEFEKKNLYKNHDLLIVEPYIEGKELTVSVIEKNGISKPIEVTEIISKKLFFDYEAKYSKGISKHILPAIIPRKIYQQCLNNAKIVHDTLGCRGISRSDFIYDEKNNKLFFLEINTQPGLTSVSLVPEQLIYNNIDLTTLIINLLNSSSCQE